MGLAGPGLGWLRDSVPGEPGLDYPVLSAVQQTAFTCDGLVLGGYYADPEQRCQVCHVNGLAGGPLERPDKHFLNMRVIAMSS